MWRCESPCCSTCSEPFHPEVGEKFTCQICRGRDFAFESAVAPYQSRGLVRELIHRFKDRQQLFLRPLLGQLMLKANEDPRMTEMAAAEWVAVPVPLHPRRHRERGFNQAQELSRAWSKATKIPTRLALKLTRPHKHAIDETSASSICIMPFRCEGVSMRSCKTNP